ncbi:hypothetical protein ACB092_05G037600 [Castanea dentata]
MNSDPEDTKSPLTQNHETPPKKKKKNKHKTPQPPPQPPSPPPPSPPVQAKVQSLKENPKKFPPFVAYFPSGYDPTKNHSNSEQIDGHESAPSVKVYRSQERPQRVEMVVTPTGSNVDFVGSNYSGESTGGHHCSYALGVFDKESQSLKIVPVAFDKVFRLEPKVRGLEATDKKTESPVKEELSAVKKADRFRELTNLYGTKKARNEAKKKHSLNQEDDPNSQKVLDRKIKEVKINKEALIGSEGAEATVARNIPPYDANAATPQEAYPLDKIILMGEWDYIADIFELLQEKPKLASNAYPTFVNNRIDKLQGIQDEAEKRTLCCIFSYITHLIKFRDQHSMDAFSSAKGHKIPGILRNRFSTMFADQLSKRLSAEKNDLIISYILVLTLYADEFRTDPADIAKDLRMSPINLRAHFEHLGCKLSRQDKLQIFTLPLPLQFPILRQKRRR